MSKSLLIEYIKKKNERDVFSMNPKPKLNKGSKELELYLSTIASTI